MSIEFLCWFLNYVVCFLVIDLMIFKGFPHSVGCVFIFLMVISEGSKFVSFDKLEFICISLSCVF